MPLSGATFKERWTDEKHSIDDLFYIVRTLILYGKADNPVQTGVH